MRESDTAHPQNPSPTEAEVAYLRSGGDEAVAELFSKCRAQLERVIELRLDRRLYGRVDPQDILQEAYLEIARRIPDFLKSPSTSFFVWARQLAWQTLLMTHRRHFGQKRDATKDVRFVWFGRDDSVSGSLAARLVSDLTPPSQALLKEENHADLRNALDKMDRIDREVLALRHFEDLGNGQVAEILGIQPTAASNRYVRALKRLKDAIGSPTQIADDDVS